MSGLGDTITRAHGRIVSVDSVDLGSSLAVDTAAGAAQLAVVNAADFPTDGGTLAINDQTIDYTSVDDPTGTITLLGTLTADAGEGDAVSLWDASVSAVATEKRALVQFDGDEGAGDPIDAAIAQSLVLDLDEGVRGDTGESVLLEHEHGLWRIIDVLGTAASLVGSTQFINTDRVTTADDSDVVLPLTHEPIIGSEHVMWHPAGGGGLHLTPLDWSRDGQLITIPAFPGLDAGDVLTCEYAYRPGINAAAASPDPSTPPNPSVIGYSRQANSNPTVSFAMPAGTQAGDLLVLSLRGPISSGGEELTLAQTCTDPRMTQVFAATATHGTTNRAVMHKVWTGVADGSGSPVVVTITPDVSNITDSIGMLAVFRGANGFGAVSALEGGTITPVISGIAAVAATAARGGGIGSSVQATPPSGYGGVGGASAEIAGVSTLLSSWYDPAATSSPAGTFNDEDCVVIALI